MQPANPGLYEHRLKPENELLEEEERQSGPVDILWVSFVNFVITHL